MDEMKYLSQGLEKIHVPLSDAKLRELLAFKKKVLAVNEYMNLTAITDAEQFIELHLIDSLSLIPYIKDGSTLIDVGTGAGFPAICIKIANPSIKITLLDSLNKRLLFLQQVIEELSLKDIKVLHSRAEDAGKGEYREKFDYVTARAVASLPVLCEYCMPLCRNGGHFLAMKAKSAEEEIALAQNAVKILGQGKISVHDLTLPYTEASRYIVDIQKRQFTPKKYPRAPKQIKTRPL